MRLIGQVITGLGEGQKIGYPTANLDCDDNTLEGGVYAAFVVYRGVRYPAALMVGGDFSGKAGPAFGGGANPQRKVEVHLLDQDMSLVGETLEVEVMERVSEMRRVSSREELLEKIEEDIRCVRALCAPLGQRTAEDR